MTKYIETIEDAREFVSYVHRSGGVVLTIKELRQGYEFAIVPPPGETAPKWGERAMSAFMINREGIYENTRNSQ